jgi:hypothetical protein
VVRHTTIEVTKLALYPELPLIGHNSFYHAWTEITAVCILYTRNNTCRVFQKELYNFESLYTFIQRTCRVFWIVIL